MVDLNDVALFVNVVTAGSFAKAARRMGLPANSASRRMQELERDLGVRLLHRSTRRLTLTDAGERLYSQCAAQIEALTQCTNEIAEGTAVPSGRIRVAVPADFFHFLPVDMMSEFLLEYPMVRLEFVMSDARADLLGEGIDVAFRIGRTMEPSLIARQLGWSCVGLVASPAYLDARGTPESPDELSNHDCIAVPTNPAGYTSWHLDGAQGEEVDVAVRGRFHANSTQAQLSASLSGLGIALLPRAMTAAAIKSGQLREVLPEYGLQGVGVYLLYLNRRHLPRAVSAFIEFTAAKMLAAGLIEPLASLK
ncbi:LysR family transcriptional regulator [Cupriavidus sp. CP313]